MSKRGGWVRGAAVLAGAAVVAAALTGAATGAGKPLTKKRALKLFYKRAQADARFVEDGGTFMVTAGAYDWVTEGNQTPYLDYGANAAALVSPGAAGTYWALLSAAVPASIYGRRMAVERVEICYDATAASSSISGVFIRIMRAPNGEGTTLAEIVDTTTRDDEACRLYAFPGPVILTEDDYLALAVRTAFSGASNVKLSRATVVLTPTGEASTAP